MAALPATLTMKEAHTAVRSLEPLVGEGSGPLVIDAGALVGFDTAAIAVLLELRRQAQAAGRTIEVHRAPQAMIELAGLYGVAELLGLPAAAPNHHQRHSARA